MKRRKKRKSLVASFFKIVISMVLIFVVFAGTGIFAYSKLRGFDSNEESTAAGDTNLLDALSGKNISTNVVVYGVDADAVRTDVIFVVHYDSKTEKISVLSVPRDTHVKMTDELIDYRKENGKYIPTDGAGASGYCKINEVYAYAGDRAKELAVKQLEDLLGIKIDNYIIVDFEAFRSIVDMVGGVDVYVPQDMYWDMRDTGDILINLKEGYQHLDGEHAEMLVRFRRYTQGDVARVQVQQEFLKALAQKVLSTDTIIKNAGSLIKTAYEYVETDFTLTDMLKYANYLDKIDKDSITMQTIPGVGEDRGGVSYYICYDDQLGETVDMFLRGTTAEIEAAKAEEEAAQNTEKNEISSKDKNIVIANGGYKDGYAAKNQQMLEAEGFTISSICTYSGDKTANTRIVVGMEGMGYDLQEYYSGSEIIVDESMLGEGEDILIIIGTEE